MRKIFILSLGVLLISAACKKETTNTDPVVSVPANYEFARDGQSSVSYSGQTERLNQLGEMKTLLKTADAGSLIAEANLLAMYENTNGDGNGNFTFTSSKQLKNKTFSLDQDYFSNLLKDAAASSVAGNTGTQATDGVAGLVNRTSATILVDANGFEYTQMFEKGIMGGVFYYQIVNNYLTDSKIGEGVDNVTVDTAKNYTAMEHHWDEAFGYFGAPTDFSGDYQGMGSPQYWAKYCNSADAVINTNDLLMFAYKQGRAAIVANEHDVKLSSANAVNVHFGEVIAASAIHYANSAKATTNQGDLLHVLTECYAFTRALRYAHQDNREMTPTEVDALLMATFKGNLWKVTISDLNDLIDELSTVYGLESVKDIL